MCIIFEKKQLEWKNFYQKKICKKKFYWVGGVGDGVGGVLSGRWVW